MPRPCAASNQKVSKSFGNVQKSSFSTIPTAEMLKKIEIRTPTLHGDQKKKCFPPSMGITFLVFATPLARERRNCDAHSTRPRAKCMNIRNQKWQYYIRGVEKMKKLQKTSRHLNKHQVENV